MKRSFKLLFFLLSGWFLTACETESCGCITMDLGIDVTLQDEAGLDLLDPSTPGYVAEEDIKIYYQINGKLETHASLNAGAQLDDPDGLRVVHEGTRYHLYITSNPTPGDEVITFIEIENHPQIKLVTQVDGKNGRRIEKVWYDDQLVWSTKMQTAPSVNVTLE